jgi:S-adenosylmethionine synthetase
MGITISGLLGPVPEERPVEIVERKGIGHPDTICDHLAEAVSLALSGAYRERFGTILHHNVDKVLLRGGEARPAFGGGTVVSPIEIFLAGRATRKVQDVELPINELALNACRIWLQRCLPELDIAHHVKFDIMLRPGSPDLVDLFMRRQHTDSILANDTSCGVGYAPLSELERVTLALERHLNSAAVRQVLPAIGSDIKIMGVRQGQYLRFIVAVALVGAHVMTVGDYLDKKDQIIEMARRKVRELTGRDAAGIDVNAADAPPGSLYLTVTGTSAEAGDDGEAGRGNRANGLITPYRPMTMESLAGKNPVNHVGKLYNLAASLIAHDLVTGNDRIRAAQCVMVSEIGRPIEQPQILDLQILPAAGASVAALAPHTEEVARRHLARLSNLADDLLDGRLAFDRWPLTG